MMARFFQWLLRLYPEAFREEYEREMTQAFRDRWRRDPGVGLALATAADTAITAAQAHGEMLGQDLRYAARSLRQNPGFALPAILTLALGIGATTAMFSLVHGILLRPTPLDQPERLVLVRDVNQKLHISGFASSEENFRDWRARTKSFVAMTAFRTIDLNLLRGTTSVRAPGVATQGAFWRTLGLRLLHGREFTAGEHRAGNHRVALLGERLWRGSFGADPAILGQTVELNGEPFTVVGIAPSYLGFHTGVDLFVPLVEDPGNRGNRGVAVAARLASGVTIQRAQAELVAITEQLETEHPKANRGWRARLVTAQDWMLEPAMRRSLWALLGAVALLWLLACANVANLLLARALARIREIGVRLALGASRARLQRQMFTESLLLGGLGGALGVAAAWAMLLGFRPFLPADLMAPERAPQLDPAVLGFALLASSASSMLFGAAPAFWFSRGGVREALASGRASSAAEPARLRQLLAGGQVGLAVVLLVGALLLLASFARMLDVDLGFRQDHLLLARFNPNEARMATPEAVIANYNRILAEVRALPGVVAAGISSEVPLGPATTELPALPVERAAMIQTEGVQAQWRVVTDGYLESLGIPILRGRFWTTTERGRPLPVVISDSLRRRFWPGGEDPLDRMIRLGNGQTYRVVGIAGDVKQLSLLAEDPTHTIYLPPWFTPWPTMNLAVRTAQDPAAVAGALREAIRRADPAQPLYDVRTMGDFLMIVVESPRLAALLLAWFATLALVLAAVGVAGLAGYSVARRRPELALRLALGATPGRVVGEVTRAHLTTCVLGLAAGIATAWTLRPLFGSLLYGVSPGDWRIYAVAAGLLLVVATVACWIPARQAVKIDPAPALRGE